MTLKGTALKRVAWATDIHLDHVDPDVARGFFQELIAAKPDALLLGGDIAVAETVETHLRQIDMMVEFPVYFVLGNHDYYYGSIQDVRLQMRTLTHGSQHLRWLPEIGVAALTPRTGLIGCGGWGDGRLGDFEHSDVRLNDYVYINDLAALDRVELLAAIRKLGQEAATHLNRVLPEALRRFEHILILMHVPPFAEACWHQGRRGDAKWLPHYTCGAAGEVIHAAARDNMYHHFTVFCGHTHGHADVHLLPNLQIKTGGVEYGNPRIQEIMEVL